MIQMLTMASTTKMAFTKIAKPATTFSIEEKVIRGTGATGLFDIGVFDSARFDVTSSGVIPEAKPATTFSSVVKPATTFASIIKPATTFTKEAKPA